eukprot:352965-Chlamydomonas_euryale.AAC.32
MVWSVGAHPCGARVFVCAPQDGEALILWDMLGIQDCVFVWVCALQTRTAAVVRQTAVSNNGVTVLAACEDGTIWRWDKQLKVGANESATQVGGGRGMAQHVTRHRRAGMHRRAPWRHVPPWILAGCGLMPAYSPSLGR